MAAGAVLSGVVSGAGAQAFVTRQTGLYLFALSVVVFPGEVRGAVALGLVTGSPAPSGIPPKTTPADSHILKNAVI